MHLFHTRTLPFRILLGLTVLRASPTNEEGWNRGSAIDKQSALKMTRTRSQQGSERERTVGGTPPDPPTGVRQRGARDRSATRNNNDGEGAQRPEHSEPDPDTEIDRERAELIELVRVQRKQQEIEALRQELAGENPGIDVEIDGVSLPTRKRRRGSSDTQEHRETTFLRSLKMADCPLFHGKSQKELQNFNIGWKNIFRGRENVEPRLWTERINLVGQRLRGDAAIAWNRNKEVYTSWEQFIAWLRTTLADPAVRMAEALQTLYRFNQGENQKVRELMIEIERLEEDIPEMTEEVRKAWILLLAIKPEIRTSVLSEHKDITSREQVLASAARHEQALALEAATKTRPARHEARHETSASRTLHTFKTQERSSSSTSTPTGPRKIEEQTQLRASEKSMTPTIPSQRGLQCYKCRGMGHVSFNCPNNRVSYSQPASGVNATSLQASKK